MIERIMTAVLMVILTFFPAVGEEPLEVSWLTCSPGTEVYELEGHTALRLRNSTTDVTINWGLFDFNAPAFVWRFALGETDYMAGAFPTDIFVDSYTRQGRTVTEQKLNLTPRQKERLYQLIDSTLLPQNRVYRYNYVLDNCATRPLDYIEKAGGYTVAITTDDSPEPTTFRKEMARYHHEYPWYQFGIDLALGSGIDRPLTVRQRGFAPIEMQRLLATATRTDSLGRQVPLVTSTAEINSPSSMPSGNDREEPWPSPLTVAIAVLVLVIASVVHDLRLCKQTKWVDCVFFSIECILGLLLTFLIFVSTHYATSPNWLYLWLNPLSFIGAVGDWVRRRSIIIAVYHALNIVAIAALAMIFIFGIQGYNAAFGPLMCASVLRSLNYLIIWKRKRALG